ncbi:MAG: hypothetical protein K0R73_407 [Candidatus Midichloriaceae bacterium]|jgi:hypothetical protein|nr:hypothetical protein [Candidatus Midichloriaceae bacterium]
MYIGSMSFLQNISLSAITGFSESSLVMLASVFDPRKGGIKPILLVGAQFILSVYYNEIWDLAIGRNKENFIHASPIWAVKEQNLEGLKSALKGSLLFSFRYSVSGFLMNCFSGYINKSVNDLLPNFVLEKVYENTETPFFLNKFGGYGQLKFSELRDNTKFLIENALTLIKAPTEIYKICTTAKSLMIFLRQITPFLPFPLNNEYAVIGSIASLIFARVAAEVYLDKKYNAENANLNQVNELKDDVEEKMLEHASKVKGRHLRGALKGQLDKYSKEQCYIEDKLNFIVRAQQYLSINPLAKGGLIMLCGYVTILYTEVSYKHVFKPIIYYADEVLNLTQGLIEFYHLKNSLIFSRDNLNELTGKISEAEKLADKGEEKIKESEVDALLQVESLTLALKTGEQRQVTDLLVNKRDIIRLKGGESTFMKAVTFGVFISEGEIKRTDSYYISGNSYLPVSNFSLTQDIAGPLVLENDKLDRINGLLGQFQIDPNTKPKTLNNEQKQIVKLISAIVSDKDLVILDTPFFGLGAENLTKCVRLIKAEAEKNNRGFLIVNDIKREGFYTKQVEMKKVAEPEVALGNQWLSTHEMRLKESKRCGNLRLCE